MTVAISATGLGKRYGTTTALDGIDLTVDAGQVMGLLGPNGAGKTTLVRILATLARADAGTATIAGADLVRDPHRVRQAIGIAGQYAALDENLSGHDNLVMLARLLGMSRAAAAARSQSLLERFGLSDAAHRPVHGYSGGMRRRADLAAAVLGRPAVLFLDEPTTGLDPTGRAQVWQMVRELATDGVAVLLTTQYLEEADALADRITVLGAGRVLAAGTPDELKNGVGARTLSVRPALPGDVGAVAAVLRTVVGTAHVDDGCSWAPVTDGSLLAQVTCRLADAGVTVDELALRLPGLDEVFATLTAPPRSVEPV